MDDDELTKLPIFRRGNVWWVRKKVPVDLARYPGEQVRKTLDTEDGREAVRRYPEALAKIERGFAQTRAELHKRGKVAGALALGRLELLNRSEIEGLVRDWWDERKAATLGRLPDPTDRIATEDALQLLDEDAGDFDAFNPGHGEPAQHAADQLLVRAGMAARPRRVGGSRTQVRFPNVNRDSAQYAYLRELVARALRSENALAQDHLTGKQNAHHDPLFHPNGTPLPGQAQPGEGHRVSDLIAVFRAEREALYGVESTARKYDLLFDVMEEVIGRDLPVRSIKRQHCVEVLTFLKTFPSNKMKKKALRDLSLRDAVEYARVHNLASLAPNTVGSYMQNLTAILRWAERGDWGVRVALAEGLIDRRSAQVKRRGFEPDELRKLFTALSVFKTTSPAKFWVPALAAFTGARAGEICQLRAADVIEVNGVACLNLSEFDAGGERAADKRLKTAASERMVPLHKTLLDAGFLEFVEKQKGETRLFSELRAGSKGSYSHGFSKWFGRFKKGVGFSGRALVFHSFRHGFRDACRRAEIPEETALALGGWAGINQATNYGDRSAVPVLEKAVQKIEYGDFDLMEF
ncbi:site-specific integrase [Phenylobacterium sp.]|uniref:site-specific integrase n=1 Tax=Phenylobacterium sp. TaxID=1871053 RepID=UPI002600A259|nr:site-specific integrase [Phenylobacterium sp.]MBX3485782.1 site-specific integrase [Phenylobacterium sp.]